MLSRKNVSSALSVMPPIVPTPPAPNASMARPAAVKSAQRDDLAGSLSINDPDLTRRITYRRVLAKIRIEIDIL